jgi:hypothetical protein
MVTWPLGSATFAAPAAGHRLDQLVADQHRVIGQLICDAVLPGDVRHMA